MFRGKFVFLFIILFSFLVHAQESEVTPTPPPEVSETALPTTSEEVSPAAEVTTPEETTSEETPIAEVAEVKAPVVPLAPGLKVVRREFGIGYVQWNEIMQLQRGTAQDSGVANYVGLTLNYDMSFYRYGGRWVTGISIAGMMGKASSGLYSGAVNFDDGVNRDWTGVLAQVTESYRFSTEFMVGGGLMARARFIDWQPIDTSVKVTTPSPLRFTGEFTLRWTLNKRYTLTQIYAPFGFDGESQWMWSLQRGF